MVFDVAGLPQPAGRLPSVCCHTRLATLLELARYVCAPCKERRMLNIPTGTWVVVADGTQARLFHNIGKQDTLRLKQEELVKPDTSDAQAQGPSGHRPPEESLEQAEEATFAKQLVHRLNAAALKQEFEHLFLIADPKTLGEMRPQLHVETSRRLTGELAKTLTNSTLEEIEKSLKANA
jgi:protein required for attachment to host cells